VDVTADKVARRLEFKVIVVPADWNKYGRAAGPIRNKQMLNLEPHILYAFHTNIGTSKGTKNMMSQAKDKGIDVVLIT